MRFYLPLTIKTRKSASKEAHNEVRIDSFIVGKTSINFDCQSIFLMFLKKLKRLYILQLLCNKLQQSTVQQNIFDWHFIA